MNQRNLHKHVRFININAMAMTDVDVFSMGLVQYGQHILILVKQKQTFILNCYDFGASHAVQNFALCVTLISLILIHSIRKESSSFHIHSTHTSIFN
jgi:hypothetical protein